MVSLPDIQSSNARIAEDLPEGLVAVFMGATSGIGETSLKQFAKHARKPRVYLAARSEESAKRVIDECKALNAEGEYIFISAEISLIRAVDEVCRVVAEKEVAVNLLFMTAGGIPSRILTSEGLHREISLNYYARTRFIQNLLPLLRTAPSLRRVVTVCAGTKEGSVDLDDIQGLKMPIYSIRGHMASVITLSLERLAKDAPEVSFVHVFPGPVNTNLGNDVESLPLRLAVRAMKLVFPLFAIPLVESGERHLHFATSARYPPAQGDAIGVGLGHGDGVDGVVVGTDGEVGSGVYAVDWDGSCLSKKAREVLAEYRENGVAAKLWEHTHEEFKRIEGL